MKKGTLPHPGEIATGERDPNERHLPHPGEEAVMMQEKLRSTCGVCGEPVHPSAPKEHLPNGGYGRICNKCFAKRGKQ